MISSEGYKFTLYIVFNCRACGREQVYFGT